MKIQITVLTDQDKETGLKFELEDLSWYIAETTFEKLLETLTQRDKPDRCPVHGEPFATWYKEWTY